MWEFPLTSGRPGRGLAGAGVRGGWTGFESTFFSSSSGIGGGSGARFGHWPISAFSKETGLEKSERLTDKQAKLWLHGEVRHRSNRTMWDVCYISSIMFAFFKATTPGKQWILFPCSLKGKKKKNVIIFSYMQKTKVKHSFSQPQNKVVKIYTTLWKINNLRKSGSKRKSSVFLKEPQHLQ